jgi:integrase
MRTKLTELKVKQTKAKDKAYKLFDGGGLFLFVSPAGGKLWRWSYRHDGKGKLASLGKYPDVSLANARKRHSEGRQLLASGVDPMAQKKEDRFREQEANHNSFAVVAAKWIEHWSAGKNARYVRVTRQRLETNITPHLGKLPVALIEAPDLVAMMQAIAKRGALEIAKRALQMTAQIFRYAIAHGYAKRNPATDFRPSDIVQPRAKVNFARVGEKQLPDLLKAIEAYEEKPLTRLALKLMALTFVRTVELLEAEWSEFDIAAARWNIPAERMKMKTPHIVPLSKQALVVLKELRAISGESKYLFPGEKRRKETTVRPNELLVGLEAIGYKHTMTGHGFRGLASTILHERGYNHEHIELQLAHTERNAVSAAYNHALYLEPRTKMMKDWANYLEQTQRGVKVLPFRSSAG